VSGSYTARTRLAWRRTVLLGTVSTVLLIRSAVERHAGWLAVAAGAIWLVLAVAGQLRIRRLTADGTAPVGAALAVAVAAAVGYAVIGTAAALIS
jgi:Domain of unknown function (DUF202)